MKINKKITKLFIIATLIVLIITLALRIKIYIEDNKLMNRTLYAYHEVEEDPKRIISIEKKHIGCLKNEFIIQSYEAIYNNKLLFGKKPENANEIVVTKRYCEEKIIDEKGMRITDKCSDQILNQTINIDGKEMKIVGIIDDCEINPNIYKFLKHINGLNQSILVSENEINEICEEEDNYYKVVFRSRKALEEYSKYNKYFGVTDIYVRSYMGYLYFLCGIMSTICVILIIRRRKDGTNKCQ